LSAEVMEETRHSGALRHSLGDLLTCRFCLDMWVATAFVVGLICAPRFTRLIAGTCPVKPIVTCPFAIEVARNIKPRQQPLSREPCLTRGRGLDPAVLGPLVIGVVWVV
jgi:Protein of unknown function (DUF1360)